MSKPDTIDDILLEYGNIQQVEGSWGDEAILHSGYHEAKAALSAMVAEIIGEDAKQVGSIPVSSAQARINRYKDEQRQRAIAKGFTL